MLQKIRSRFLFIVLVVLSIVLPGGIFQASVSLGADKLVVKDSTGTNTKFVATDQGIVGIGFGTPSGGSLHVNAGNVATLNDILGLNQPAGAGFDIQTAAGTPPSGAIEAINGIFLIKYTPGATVSNNFNTFRMIARTDSTMTDPITGLLAAGNFMTQHKGGNTASYAIGLTTNVALQGTGNITNATALKAASPSRTGTGAISNAYGVNILSQKTTGVTNGYGVYQEGANDYNYFAGKAGIGTNAPTALLDVNSNGIRIRTARTPASSGESCNQGDMAWDSNYVYVCVTANSWKRSTLASW